MNSKPPVPTRRAAAPDAWSRTLDQLDEIRQLERRVADMKRALVTPGPDASSPGHREVSLLLARLGQRLIAVPMEHVEEVTRMVALTPTDSHLSAVLGLVDYHGDPVAVLDPRGLMDEAMPPVRATQAVVFCRLPTLRIGLRVDDVDDVVEVSASAFTAAEEVLPGGMQSTGVVRTPEGSALVFEPLLLALAAELVSLDGRSEPGG